jgi:hypothetical protein
VIGPVGVCVTLRSADAVPVLVTVLLVRVPASFFEVSVTVLLIDAVDPEEVAATTSKVSEAPVALTGPASENDTEVVPAGIGAAGLGVKVSGPLSCVAETAVRPVGRLSVIWTVVSELTVGVYVIVYVTGAPAVYVAGPARLTVGTARSSRDSMVGRKDRPGWRGWRVLRAPLSLDREIRSRQNRHTTLNMLASSTSEVRKKGMSRMTGSRMRDLWWYRLLTSNRHREVTTNRYTAPGGLEARR